MLLIVDVQDAFFDQKWGERNNLNAENNIKTVLDVWRQNRWEVIHVQHKSDHPSSVFYENGEGFAIKEIVAPLDNEKIITKTVISAFIGTDLNDYLKNIGTSHVVVTGLTTPHCVSTTTRMSGNLGYDTYLLSDATAAFELNDHNGNKVDAETVHHISLATLHDEFATVLTTKQYLENFTQ
ncbi:cysteine hydrolase family protein [Pseudalkalibacillus berkeleyi]|uniref:Cysteine hydrolase n=1 Tax=Pseudalkalibacillus berkeleyi TaxID=1069813 RepID=A0ABS9GYR9_9BACL|nr:cysteine hydrolase family protein [Pseudalkalibacillus berkeleyi]MCF6137829.1 cysteine hydrolase [Pseudalkalibacillus berkeleyi]